MPDLLKASLVLAAFALLSVIVTAAAAGLALQRPAVSQLTLETRSRLVADYSADPLARRLEPLDPDVIRAAAEDEAALSQDSSATRQPGEQPVATVTPGADAQNTSTPDTGTTAAPAPSTATPRPSNTPASAASATPGAAETAVPSPTATPVTPTATFTPQPTFTPTPKPTSTPLPTATPQPTSTPVPTATPRPPTSTPLPTTTPPPTPDDGGLVCELLPILCDLL